MEHDIASNIVSGAQDMIETFGPDVETQQYSFTKVEILPKVSFTTRLVLFLNSSCSVVDSPIYANPLDAWKKFPIINALDSPPRLTLSQCENMKSLCKLSKINNHGQHFVLIHRLILRV
ncbi:unnamed protein product [Arabidopsis halleri]